MPLRIWAVRSSNLFIHKDHTTAKIMAALILSKFSCARMEAFFYRVKTTNEMEIVEMGNDDGLFIHINKGNIQVHLYT